MFNSHYSISALCVQKARRILLKETEAQWSLLVILEQPARFVCYKF